jgi:hypothetical protein
MGERNQIPSIESLVFKQLDYQKKELTTPVACSFFPAVTTLLLPVT